MLGALAARHAGSLLLEGPRLALVGPPLRAALAAVLGGGARPGDGGVASGDLAQLRAPRGGGGYRFSRDRESLFR